MNKLLTLGLIGIILVNCRQSEDPAPVTNTTLPATTATQQNQYDDDAIQNYLENHYLNEQGKVTKVTDKTPETTPRLSQMNPIKLSSGVVYIVRPDAQPTNGQDIESSDNLTIMQNAYVMQAEASTTTSPTFGSNYIPFFNGVTISGNLTKDPSYFYVKKSILDANPTKPASYYEIEGLSEALRHFKAFNKADDEEYNLQGVILIPSRAAFGKDVHFPYLGGSETNLQDKTFMFNFQIYRAEPRPENEIRR